MSQFFISRELYIFAVFYQKSHDLYKQKANLLVKLCIFTKETNYEIQDMMEKKNE